MFLYAIPVNTGTGKHFSYKLNSHTKRGFRNTALNIGFLCQYVSNHVVRKLQEPYKNVFIAGVNESMLSLMP